MSIKMRNNKEEGTKCNVCLQEQKEVLRMYDILFGDCKIIIKICDECAEELFRKVLKANVELQGATKTSREIQIINKRNRIKKGTDWIKGAE